MHVFPTTEKGLVYPFKTSQVGGSTQLAKGSNVDTNSRFCLPSLSYKKQQNKHCFFKSVNIICDGSFIKIQGKKQKRN